MGTCGFDANVGNSPATLYFFYRQRVSFTIADCVLDTESLQNVLYIPIHTHLEAERVGNINFAYNIYASAQEHYLQATNCLVAKKANAYTERNMKFLEWSCASNTESHSNKELFLLALFKTRQSACLIQHSFKTELM